MRWPSYSFHADFSLDCRALERTWTSCWWQSSQQKLLYPCWTSACMPIEMHSITINTLSTPQLYSVFYSLTFIHRSLSSFYLVCLKGIEIMWWAVYREVTFSLSGKSHWLFLSFVGDTKTILHWERRLQHFNLHATITYKLCIRYNNITGMGL